MRSVVVVICALISTHVFGQLLRCDTAKIAITSDPFMSAPSADACGAQALGGKSIRSIFETSATSPDTIAKMVNTPSCQTWWKEMSAPFASFKPCTYLGMTIQDFSKLSLQAFLDANNKEILSFDPNRPADTSPIEYGDELEPTTATPTTATPTTVVVVATTPPPTTTTATTMPPTTTVVATAVPTSTVITPSPGPTAARADTTTIAPSPLPSAVTSAASSHSSWIAGVVVVAVAGIPGIQLL